MKNEGKKSTRTFKRYNFKENPNGFSSLIFHFPFFIFHFIKDWGITH